MYNMSGAHSNTVVGLFNKNSVSCFRIQGSGMVVVHFEVVVPLASRFQTASSSQDIHGFSLSLELPTDLLAFRKYNCTVGGVVDFFSPSGRVHVCLNLSDVRVGGRMNPSRGVRACASHDYQTR